MIFFNIYAIVYIIFMVRSEVNVSSTEDETSTRYDLSTFL